jgi:hypothetical protein
MDAKLFLLKYISKHVELSFIPLESILFDARVKSNIIYIYINKIHMVLLNYPFLIS